MANLESSIAGEALPYLERIENIMADMESKRGKYMAACKSDREDIKEIYTEAKAAGVPPKSLKGVVRYRELEKRQKAIAAGLDIDEQSTYESLIEALGDFAGTPLGEASLSKATLKAARKFTSAMEEPVPLTDEEKAQGVTAAFVDKDGTRSSISVPGRRGRKPKSDAEKRAEITAVEQAEKIDEIDKSFSERLREQNDAVNRQLNEGTFGEDGQEAA